MTNVDDVPRSTSQRSSPTPAATGCGSSVRGAWASPRPVPTSRCRPRSPTYDSRPATWRSRSSRARSAAPSCSSRITLQLPTSWFVSLGDKADVSGNDLLQFWEDDEATKVIAIYTESLGNPRKFARIARRVSLTRPIVSVRTGTALVRRRDRRLVRPHGSDPGAHRDGDARHGANAVDAAVDDRPAGCRREQLAKPDRAGDGVAASVGLEVVDPPFGSRGAARPTTTRAAWRQRSPTTASTPSW